MGNVKQEIVNYLKKNRYCVLCTCSENSPRATPVRYWSDDVKIIIYSEKYTAKFKLLEKNSNVSLAIYSTRSPLKGLQLWGKAEVINSGDERHDMYLPPQIKKNPKLQGVKKVLDLIQITPNKIVMLDQSKKGNCFLLWESDKMGKGKEKEIKTLRGASKV